VPKTVITLPAYRAELTLARTIQDIPSGVADLLIVVDDASPDDTVKVARDLGLRVVVHPKNRGYGGNQKTCYQEALKAGADIVILLHPDYQYDPRAVRLLVAPILAGDADMTFGSRFAGLGDPIGGGMPWYRYAGNRITTIAENAMLGSRFTEMHSGMRAYTRKCLLSLPFLGYSDDFVFDSQLMVDAVTVGLRVVEVPIPTRYTKESSSISVPRSVRYTSSSLAYCARRASVRGRRGRRWPPVGKKATPNGGSPEGPPVERLCTMCGETRQVLLIPATASGPPGEDEFTCTTRDLGQHDDIVRCLTCGLVSSIPQLGRDAIVHQYEESVDTAYLQEEQIRRDRFGKVLDSIEAFPVRGRRLLDVGAHVGLFLDVAGQRDWEARGVEPSEWSVATGRRRFGVDLRQGTAEDLGEPDSGADVVVLLDMLEHVADPLAVLRGVRHVVDEEGLLAVTTLNLSGIHARIQAERWPWFTRSHLYYFTPDVLRDLYRRARFRMVHWAAAPREIHLSQLGRRLVGHRPLIAGAVERVSSLVDPKLPAGWLGDVSLTLARPM
jgi:SAM-dependent methyltransferase